MIFASFMIISGKNNRHQMFEDPLIGSNTNTKITQTRIRTSLTNYLTEERSFRGEKDRNQILSVKCVYLHHYTRALGLFVFLSDCSVTSPTPLSRLSVLCIIHTAYCSSVKLQSQRLPGLTQPVSLQILCFSSPEQRLYSFRNDIWRPTVCMLLCQKKKNVIKKKSH